MRPGQAAILDHVAGLFANEQLSDVVIEAADPGCDALRLPAHTLVLFQSRVFRAILAHDFKEKEERVVRIGEASAAHVRELLQFLYTGESGGGRRGSG